MVPNLAFNYKLIKKIQEGTIPANKTFRVIQQQLIMLLHAEKRIQKQKEGGENEEEKTKRM